MNGKSVKDVDRAVAELESKLQSARLAVADQERIDAERILVEAASLAGLDDLLRQMEAENEVSGAALLADLPPTLPQLHAKVGAIEVALAMAHRERIGAQRAERRDRANRLRAEAAADQQEAENQAAILNELGPRVEMARNQMEHFVRVGTQKELQADDIEHRLKLEAEEGT